MHKQLKYKVYGHIVLVLKEGDSTLYKPFEIGLHVCFQNNTSDSIFIISDSKYLKKQPKLGYLELRFKDKMPFRLKSEFNTCVPDNAEIILYAGSYFVDEHSTNYDYGKDSVFEDNPVLLPPAESYSFSYFVDKFESFDELYKEIISNATLYYKCIEKGYLAKGCGSLFPSTEVVMDDYFITLVDGGDTLKKSYYVKDKKGTLVESF